MSQHLLRHRKGLPFRPFRLPLHEHLTSLIPSGTLATFWRPTTTPTPTAWTYAIPAVRRRRRGNADLPTAMATASSMNTISSQGRRYNGNKVVTSGEFTDPTRASPTMPICGTSSTTPSDPRRRPWLGYNDGQITNYDGYAKSTHTQNGHYSAQWQAMPQLPSGR